MFGEEARSEVQTAGGQVEKARQRAGGLRPGEVGGETADPTKGGRVLPRQEGGSRTVVRCS